MNTVRTSHYFSAEQLRTERSVLESSWVLAAMSSQLPTVHSKWLFEMQSYSVLLMRGEDNIVRAFYNSCLHRGTKLMEATKKHRSPCNDEMLTCPYHGWQYDSKGCLRHIPRSSGIEVREGARLKSLQVREAAGLIWVCLGKPRETFDDFLPAIPKALQKYNLEEMQPIEARDFEFSVNWKVSLENALDYYHVSTVHGQSVSALVEESPTFKPIHWHSLQTLNIAPYKWRSWIDQKCARHSEYSPHEMSSLHKYFIFPNLVLNVLPYHLTIMQIWPIDERRCQMRYRFCYRKNPSMIERIRAYASWLASRYILYEDVRIYSSIQKGMELSVIKEQPLHNEEIGALHFHRSMAKWISDRPVG